MEGVVTAPAVGSPQESATRKSRVAPLYSSAVHVPPLWQKPAPGLPSLLPFAQRSPMVMRIQRPQLWPLFHRPIFGSPSGIGRLYIV